MSLILSGSDGLSDVDGSAATPAIRGTDANTGIFFPTADTIAFATGGTEDARFNSAGNLQTIGTISVGNATPSTSGAGITFPAAQSASTDVNTLDDYEEGTFTASFGNGTFTYASRAARYVKIGKLVTVGGSIIWSAKSGTGAITISGLPFTSDSTAFYRATGSLGYTSGVTLSGVTAAWSMSGGATTFTLLNIYSTTASDACEVVNMSGSGEVQFSLTYEA
jgi:hypothetical protein